MNTQDKPLVWMHGEIATPPFSENARIEAGYLLRQLQNGKPLTLPQSKTMPSIGKEMTKMHKRKKKTLEGKGYRIGSADEFLGLNKKESEYIELKLALSQALSVRRRKSNLTQVQLAKMIKSSQSRIAKMEKGDPTVTIDLLVRSLLAMGATKESIAKAIV